MMIMAKAKSGDKVRINFTGRLEDGTIFDSTVDHADCELDDCECEIGPMELLLGEGDFFPQVEMALIDLEVGSKLNIIIKAEDAFGEYDEEKVFVVEKDQFPEDINPEPGQNLELIDEEDLFEGPIEAGARERPHAVGTLERQGITNGDRGNRARHPDLCFPRAEPGIGVPSGVHRLQHDTCGSAGTGRPRHIHFGCTFR